jgi:hypothetical protein
MDHFDSQSSILANWGAGNNLDDALFLYSSERLRQSYRGSHPDSDLRGSIRMLMAIEVQHRLASGELTAVALQSEPVSNGDPTVIPPNYFKSPSIEIDWERSKVRWNNHHFSDTTIVVGRISQHDGSSSGLNQFHARDSEDIERRPVGRPAFKGDIDRVIDALVGDGADLFGPPWKPVVALIRAEAVGLGFAFAGKKPSNETIRRRLVKKGFSKLN